jgi:hypothetical protein
MKWPSLVLVCLIAQLSGCAVCSSCRVIEQNLSRKSSSNTPVKKNVPAGQKFEISTQKTKANTAQKSIEINLIDRENGRFTILNNSRHTINLSSIYMKGWAKMFPDIPRFATGEGDFFPALFRYGRKKNGKWVYGEDTANAISYKYPLTAGETVDCVLSLEVFEIMEVPRGEYVRIGVDGYLSKPFRW